MRPIPPKKPKRTRNTDVRILPAVIGVAGILLALKAGGLAFTAIAAPEQPDTKQVATAAPQTPAPPPNALPANPNLLPKPVRGPAQKPPIAAPTVAVDVKGALDPLSPINAALPNPLGKPTLAQVENPPPATDNLPGDNSGLSSAEMDVLTSLADRRDVLDDRQRELDTKANVLAAAEKRVDDKIAQLKALQTRIEQLLGQRDQMEEAQLTSLVKVYSGMKDVDAARVFATLNDEVRLGIASHMKPDDMGKILAKLPADVAQKLTVEIAGRYKMPADTAAAAAAAIPVAAPAPAAAAPPAAATPAQTAPAAPAPAAKPGG